MGEAVNLGGWEAIDRRFQELYPGQDNPTHFGTLISWRLGGPDPLDGISAYDGGDFWHFVTYGFSELYEKEGKDPKVSGYGFELTVRLCKEGGEDEIGCMAGILQSLARYVFEEGAVFRPYEYIYTGQEAGMDSAGGSKLTGFVTAPDDLAGVIRTPNGRVEFVQLVGATDRELKAILEKRETVRGLLEKLGHTRTDYTRGDLL